MKFYFQLQFRRAILILDQIGLNPYLATMIVSFAFILGSIYILNIKEYGRYIYIVIAIIGSVKIQDYEREEFNLHIYTQFENYKIRLIENIAFITPFLIALFGKHYMCEGLVLIAFGFLFSIPYRIKFNLKVIPTPFYNNPFEFIIGFRKTVMVIIIMYFVLYKSIEVQNFNLGVFTMIAILFLSLSYYTKPEKEYYVWIYNLSPKLFILSKLKHGILHFSILAAPVITALIVFFPNQWFAIIIIYFLSIFYLVQIILAKYSVYPEEMNLPQGLIIALSIPLPPFLICSLLYFYRKSFIKLSKYLS